MNKKTVAGIVLTIALAQGAALAQWTAYNDFSIKEADPINHPSHANTTEIRVDAPTGLLTNVADGSSTGVTLSIALGSATGQDGAVKNSGYVNAGTEAHNEFEGFVDLDGYIYGNGEVTITLAGLDPTATYTAVLFGNRGGGYTDRDTVITIGGADDFVNSSTAGATFGGPTDPTTNINTGDMTAAGQVFRYSDIEAGADGQVTFTAAAGERNYINAFKLVETVAVPEPGTLGLMAVFGGALLFFRRKQMR